MIAKPSPHTESTLAWRHSRGWLHPLTVRENRGNPPRVHTRLSVTWLQCSTDYIHVRTLRVCRPIHVHLQLSARSNACRCKWTRQNIGGSLRLQYGRDLGVDVSPPIFVQQQNVSALHRTLLRLLPRHGSTPLYIS